MAEPVQQSLLTWLIQSLGGFNILLLCIATLVAVLLILILVLRGKGPPAAAAIVLIVHLPLLAGLFGALISAMRVMQVIAASEVSPPPAQLLAASAEILVALLFGLLLMAPGYAIATVGLTIRSFLREPNR